LARVVSHLLIRGDPKTPTGRIRKSDPSGNCR
jgi:hypothetical protein